MNVKIIAIRDAGIPKKERLVLRVLRNDDIGYYVVLDTISSNGGIIPGRIRHSYWFPDKKVAAGDLVILYTKSGTQSEKQREDGSIAHFFYWKLDKPIWNIERDCAVLLEARNWIAKGAF